MVHSTDLLKNEISSKYKKIEVELNNSNKELDSLKLKTTRDINKSNELAAESIKTINKLISNFSLIQTSIQSDNIAIKDFDESFTRLKDIINKYEIPIQQTVEISSKEIEKSRELINSVSHFYDNVDNTDDLIIGIDKGIDNIREVTGIINDITEKTSILSLNAAIESAHAGEAGKG